MPETKKKPEVPLDQLPDPLGIIRMMTPPKREDPIPVHFFPAPGSAAKSPGKNPLPSDKDRVAHGGDPKLPKAAVPRAVAREGIRDLESGARGGERPEKRDPPAERTADASTEAPRRAEQPRPLAGLPGPTLSRLTAADVGKESGRGSADGGDEGAGFEREGGFVDSGPLSFDTIGYDWGSYADAMIRKIKRNWDVPALAHYGVKGRVTIRFFITKTGAVEDIRILSSSGTPPFDNAAFQAIFQSNPFRPLPKDLGHDREGVTVTFFYNIRPEDAASGGRSR